MSNTEMGAIVTLYGNEGSGRRTLAAYLVERHGFSPFSIRDLIADRLAVAFGCTPDAFTGGATDHPQDRFAIVAVGDPDYRKFLAGFHRYDIYTPRSADFHMLEYGVSYQVYQREAHRWGALLVNRIAESGAIKVVVPDVTVSAWLALRMHARIHDMRFSTARVERPRRSASGRLPKPQVDFPNSWVDRGVVNIEHHPERLVEHADALADPAG